MGKPNPMYRTKFWNPKKGTKTRAVLLHMLRPQGVTAPEAIASGIIVRQSDIAAHLDLFFNLGGWDIRVFPGATRSDYVRYKVVGRLRFKGGYRSLVNSG